MDGVVMSTAREIRVTEAIEAGARWIFECGPDGGVEPLTRDIVA